MAGGCAARLALACWGLAAARAEVNDECSRITGGTCYLFGCDQSRGETDCADGQCVCKEGYCDSGGICVRGRSLQPRCGAETGGTCFLSGCHDWRGATTCSDASCVCDPGTCNELGVCHPDRGTFAARVAPVSKEHPVFPGPHGKVNSALVFSGGASRAMTVSFGSLRALHHLGLLEQFDLLSSNSGSTWAAAVYMFAKMPLEELLGLPTDPSTLTMDTIGRTPAALGAAATVSTTDIMSRLFFEEDVSGPLLWSYTVGEAILKKFGLDDKNAYMAASQEDVERIKKANPQLEDRDFLIPASGRPKAFVMSGSLLAPSGYQATERTVVSLQMSPDYSGSPFYPNNSRVAFQPADNDLSETGTLRDVIVGGGFVESFAFGGQAPLRGQSGGDTVDMASPMEPLSLMKAVGVSSAGPALAFNQFANLVDVSFLDPISNYWPVTSPELPGPQEAMTYQLGDGGSIDNSGLLVALQRGAKRAVWLINSELPIAEADFCGMATAAEVAQVAGQLDFQLQANFGFMTSPRVGEFLSQNQVFAREELAPLLCELRGLVEAGRPAISKRRMTVLANSWWGIKSYKATIAFVYAERCSNFEALLPDDTKEELALGAMGKLANYPHYNMVLQNVGELTALLPEQVNLLAAQSEYSILQNQDLFKSLFCERDTGGTCRIFGCASSRSATCVEGRCVCDAEADMCSVGGRCLVDGEPAGEGEAATFLAEKARGQALLSIAACAALASVGIALGVAGRRLWRRHRVHISQEPLLG